MQTRGCYGMWVMLGVLCVAFATASGGAARGEPLSIDQSIRNLDADRFELRAAATDRLIAAGGSVAPSLAAALPQASTEMIWRGVHVLKQVALSADDASRDAAYAELERLAQATDARLSRRAGAALELVERTRMQEVVEQLVRAGLVIQYDGQAMGLMFGNTGTAVTIGPAWKGTPQQLELLRWLREVESVRLTGPQIDDSYLTAVAKMKRVKSLMISRARITDAGIAPLQDMKTLQQLTICYSPLTDAASAHLQGMTRLHAICLCGTGMTREAAAALQEALGPVTLDFRHGAFMGLSCRSESTGCYVSTVQPRSAAELGGLQPDDHILSYNGQPVASFDELVNLIAENRAGETVSVEVERAGAKQSLSVTLGEWDDESLQNALPRAPRTRLGR